MSARSLFALAIFLLLLTPARAFAADDVEVRVVLTDIAAGAMEQVAATYGAVVRSVVDDTTAIIAVPVSRQSLLSRDPRIRDVSAASAHPVLATNGWTEGMTYTYDAAGNITQIGSGSSADVFVYDSADRLVKGKVSGKERQYAYDAFGNRTGCNDIASGSPCQPVTIVTASNRIQNAVYDAAGSVTQFSSKTYTYDNLGMLTRDTLTLPAREYLYTADDERLAVITGSTWNWTIRDLSGKVLREFTSNGSTWQWTRDNIWRNGQLLSSLQPSGSTSVLWHYHLDHLGTPRLVTNTTGTILGVHDYHAFGTETSGNAKEAPESRLKFTSHERDSLGNPAEPLDYMHARYYQSGWGRFLSVDPMRESADLSDPQTWNRYAYVRNNPLRYTDPDGKDKLAAWLLGPSYKDVSTVEALFGPGLRAQFRSAAADFDNAFSTRVIVALAQMSVGACMVVGPAPTMSPQARGRANEAKVLEDMGMTKNTEKVTTSKGNSIPDGMDTTKLVEVKDTKSVSNTSQIQIQREAAQTTGREHVVVTGTSTKVSRPVQENSTVIRRDDIGPQPPL